MSGVGKFGVLLRNSRTFSLVGVVLVVMILGVAGLTIWDQHAEAIESYQRNMTNLGVALAEQTSRSMQAVDIVVRETEEKIVAAGADTAEGFDRLAGTQSFNDFLVSQLKSLPQANSIVVTNREGWVINSSSVWPAPGINVADRDFFIHFRDQADPGLFISAPVENRRAGTWVYYLARRVSSPAGEFLGVVQGAIAVQYLEDAYKAITLQSGSSVTVLRRDGTIIARYPHIPNMIGNVMPANSPWHQRVASGGGSFRSPGYFDGAVRVVTVHPLREYPLIVNMTVLEDEALARWRWHSEILAGAALAVTIAFAILFRILTTQFRRLERSEASLEAANAKLNKAFTDAAAASRAKSDFLANMSHELRTPLNAIIGFSEMMEQAIVGPISQRYRQYAADICDSGRHLLQVINDILDLTKVEAGKLELRESAVSVREVLEGCMRLIEPRAQKSGVRLMTDFARDLPRLWADEARLRQIGLNLLSNAVKFTLSGGEVRLLTELDGEGGIRITVADSGIGMTPDEVAIALEPFGQVTRSTAANEGTGLGLPLTKTLVELHGGTLEITSSPGVGTSVAAAFPPARTMLASPAQAVSS